MPPGVYPRKSTQERFEENIVIDEVTKCWGWIGCKDRDGYGYFNVNGKNCRAHRYSYIQKYGDIPDGLLVRHKCKNKCVNPEHLELGTPQQNTDDRIRDNTMMKGETHPNAKLTEDDAREIKYSKLLTYQELADKFGISKAQVKTIKGGRCWSWI